MFKSVKFRYFFQSLKVLIPWVVVYGLAVFVYFLSASVFSSLYIVPAHLFGLENFVWFNSYNKVFLTIAIFSLIYNAGFVLGVLPFSDDNAKTKFAQFIVGFIISIAFFLVSIGVLGLLFGLEAKGVLIYSAFCLVYFPGMFIISRFFVPTTYRAAYWFTGGKIKER